MSNFWCIVLSRLTVSLASNSNEVYEKLFSKDIFEGDLKIPIEMVMTYYNASSVPNGSFTFQNMNKGRSDVHHAAIRSHYYLWPDGKVYYKISSSFKRKELSTIHRAIHHWEDNTCLQFRPVRNQRNYVFISNNGYACYSTSIGYSTGVQTINLGQGCVVFSIIVHEIGHAVGFWHEQSRPDRDKYIALKFNNIQRSTMTNFFKVKDIYTDNYGAVYDYGSIMHYTPYTFRKAGCVGDCVTFTVANAAEYQRQGAPSIGFSRELSTGDKAQANRMYSCRGKGVTGFLLIKMKYGSIKFNYPYIFVRVAAADDNGEQFYILTQPIKYVHHAVWNELIFFNYSSWQFFRLSIRDIDYNRLIQSKTVPIQQNYHSHWDNCDAQICTNFVLYDFVLDASPVIFTRLKIYTRLARHLINTDPNDQPDPYVRVDAVQFNGVPKIAYSVVMFNTTNPIWNYWIDFGCNTWKLIYIQIFEEDLGRDDRLSDRQIIILELGSHRDIRHLCYGSGEFIYDYIFTDSVNSCTP